MQTGKSCRRGLRDRFDLKTLDLCAVDVARDAGEAGIDDKADAGNRDRCFGHVRGEDDAAALGKSKGALLFAVAEDGEGFAAHELAHEDADDVAVRIANVLVFAIDIMRTEDHIVEAEHLLGLLEIKFQIFLLMKLFILVLLYIGEVCQKNYLLH